MRTKNKAIRVICNAQVKYYSNTINLWKHLISRIRRHDFCNQLINEWRMARGTVCLLTTHILKRGQGSLCFQPLPSNFMMILAQKYF